jgi:4-amino-4-deoxy-L-arabinose transferase-like glycosyltransferase
VAGRLDEWARRGVPVVAFIVLALGVVIRFHGLDRQSLWLDELYSVQSSRSLERLAYFYTWDLHPPLYSLALWVWMGVAGTSEWAVRLPSALSGCAMLFVIWFLGRERFGVTVALAFLGLAAFSSRAVYFAQEARSYSFLILVCTALTILWVGRMVEPAGSRERAGTLWLVLLSVVAGWTHYYGTIFVFCLWGGLLLSKLLSGGLSARWFLAAAVVVAACLGEYFVHNQFIAGTELPFHVEVAGLWWELPRYFYGTAFGVVVFFLGGIGVVAANLRGGGGGLPDGKRLLKVALVLLALCAAVTTGALVLNAVRNSFSPRNLLVIFPALLLLSAVALAGLTGRFRAGVAVGVCIAACIQFLCSAPWYWRGEGKQQWRESAQVAAAAATKNSVVVTVTDAGSRVVASPLDIGPDAWGFYFEKNPGLVALNAAGRVYRANPAGLREVADEAMRRGADSMVVVRAHESDREAVREALVGLGYPFHASLLSKSDTWVVDLR